MASSTQPEPTKVAGMAFVAVAGSLATLAPRHLRRPFEILAPQAAALAHNQLDSSNVALSGD